MRSFILAAAFVSQVPALLAQAKTSVVPGDRIWAQNHRPTGGWDRGIKGTVVSVGEDGLRLDVTVHGAPIVVPESPEVRVRVSAGKRSSALRGLGYGFAIGASALGVAGLAAGEDCSHSPGFICFDRGATAAAGAIVGGGLGAIIGLIVGGLSHHEEWRAVSGPVALHPVIAPARGGARLGVGLSF